jgi:hypothetical protein
MLVLSPFMVILSFCNPALFQAFLDAGYSLWVWVNL